MGTNYFLHRGPCKSCGRGGEKLHIGKSSAGWCFALRYIEGKAESLDDWRKLFAEGVIKSEYGRSISVAEMLAVITDREHLGDRHRLLEEEFLEVNHAEPGPGGLLRSRLEEGFCVAHGAGTWDMRPGDFR